MKIILTIWTDAAWHPVVIFTAQMLAERGNTVHVVYRTVSPELRIPGGFDFGAAIQLHGIGSGRLGWRNRLAFLWFLVCAFRLAQWLKPEAIVGYDMHGLLAAYSSYLGCRTARLIYHNLDLAEPQMLGPFDRLVKRAELRVVRAAALTLFSSPERAKVFQAETVLPQSPWIVMNCQRLNAPPRRTGALSAMLRERDLHFDRLVVRLGMMAPGHGLEAIMRSIPAWRGRWGLLLAGVPLPSYLAGLRQLVADLRLDRQVVILPSVPYDLWYDCLYAGHLGLALYETTDNLNHLSMAGAGNKLNLYLKAGIPSLVPDIPDFVAFVEKYQAAVVADPCDPASIAQAINGVFADEAQYQAMCQRARRAFETVFNFEKQFEPVLQWLNDCCDIEA